MKTTILILSVLGIASIDLFGLPGVPEREKKLLMKPSQNIEHFSFGYKDNIADSLWLRVIQNYDHCDQQRLKAHGLVKGKDQPIFGPNRVMNCERGWVYQMLKVIMTMSPRFEAPALSGGVILSVLVDDIEGATEIFDIATKNHPTNWSVWYRAAYHHLYETENKERAAEMLIRAGQYGAPSWVFSLASRLYTEAGKLELARSMILSLLKDMKDDDPMADKLKERLQEIEKEFNKL